MSCATERIKGNVYYRLSDGSIAINVQGMEAEIFAKYLEIMAKKMGKDSTCRNADEHEVANLGYGAWYILEEAAK